MNNDFNNMRIINTIEQADMQLTNDVNMYLRRRCDEQTIKTIVSRIKLLFQNINGINKMEKLPIDKYDEFIEMVDKWRRYCAAMQIVIEIPNIPFSKEYMPMRATKWIPRQTLVGIVTKKSGNKTVNVTIVSSTKHPKYNKIVRSSKSYLVHDEHDVADVGDNVIIVSCRPMSKTKHFRLFRLLNKNNIQYIESTIQD